MTALIEDARVSHLEGLDMRWLRGDAVSVLVASSETIALTLTFLFSELACHPDQVEKLRFEMQGITNIFDIRELQTLPHLTAVINETFRLHPPVPTNGLRISPPEGLIIAGRHVPGDVLICAPAFSLGRLESCYEDATEFVPERWYSKPSLIRNKAGFAPFSLGSLP